jgi:hypothetical protein
LLRNARKLGSATRIRELPPDALAHPPDAVVHAGSRRGDRLDRLEGSGIM